MSVKDLIAKNRSYRGYDESRKLTKEELMDLVDCARLSASSVNLQPLKYYIAYEEEEVKRIQKLTAWARALPLIKLPHEGMCPTGWVVICQDKKIAPNTDRFQKDVGIAAQSMLLRATELDLGGCMIGNFKPKEVRKELNLPETLEPLLLVAVGKPAETIVLVDVEDDGKTNYYRDKNDTHYVPKRKLEDVVLTKENL